MLTVMLTLLLPGCRALPDAGHVQHQLPLLDHQRESYLESNELLIKSVDFVLLVSLDLQRTCKITRPVVCTGRGSDPAARGHGGPQLRHHRGVRPVRGQEDTEQGRRLHPDHPV